MEPITVILSFIGVILFFGAVQVIMWYGQKWLWKLNLWNWERKLNLLKAQQKKEALLGKGLRTQTKI